MSVGVMKDEKMKLRHLHVSIHCVVWGTETHKETDEVNTREVCECDG
jgi:hypothetical protein